MALIYATVKMVAPYLTDSSILSLGYPDILITKEQTEELFGVVPDSFTKHGEWHGVNDPIPETAELFRLLGSTFECVDIVRSRGAEKIIDLNYPSFLGYHDIVIDAGTTEHCFNFAQALINAANAVKVGGRIFHTPPVTMLNHGFYCVQPTLLNDFYVQNGWEIESMEILHKGELYDCPRTHRFKAPMDASICCLAKRTNDLELKFPIQTKYLKNPHLKRKA